MGICILTFFFFFLNGALFSVMVILTDVRSEGLNEEWFGNSRSRSPRPNAVMLICLSWYSQGRNSKFEVLSLIDSIKIQRHKILMSLSISEWSLWGCVFLKDGRMIVMIVCVVMIIAQSIFPIPFLRSSSQKQPHVATFGH